MGSAEGEDSLVGGLWNAWFKEWNLQFENKRAVISLENLFEKSIKRAYMENVYQVLNALKARCGVPEEYQDPWHLHLQDIMKSCWQGEVDAIKLSALQERYRKHSTPVLITSHTTKKEVDLVLEAKEAMKCIAHPSAVWGNKSIKGNSITKMWNKELEEGIKIPPDLHILIYDLGFDRKDAQRALKKTNNLQAAVALLTEGGV